MKKCYFIAIYMLASLLVQAQPNQTIQVKTINGIVEGMKEVSGVASFKGIPFASATRRY
jgi:para-nitrobenzyl esterase